MKKILLILLLCLVFANISYGEVESLSGFGGLNVSQDSFLIPDNEASDIQNVVMDSPRGTISGRKGRVDYSDALPSSWDVDYQANELPQDATPVWVRYADGTPNTESIIDGKLVINCTVPDTVRYSTSSLFNNATGWTVEARMKLEIVSAAEYVEIDITDGAWDVSVRFLENSVQVRSYPYDEKYYMDTTDDYHIYRITGQGTSLNVYVDNTLRISGTMQSATGQNKVMFGNIITKLGTVESRWDYVKISTQSAYASCSFNDIIYSQSEFTPTSGTKYMLAESTATSVGPAGTHSIYTTSGDGTWTETITGLNANYSCNYEIYQDVIWCVNGDSSDDPQYWDGATVTDSTECPEGNLIQLWNERLHIAGDTGAKSTIYWSDPLLGPKVVGGWDTGNNYWVCGTDDGTIITGIKVLNGDLIVFKEESIYKIIEIGENHSGDPLVRIDMIVSGIGCIDGGSIRHSMDSSLIYFLAKREPYVWAFDGYKVYPIGEKIKTEFEGIQQTYAYKDSDLQVWDTYSQFTASGSTWTNVGVDGIGFVSLEQYEWEQDTTDDFSAGTTSHTTITDGAIKLQRDTANNHFSSNNVVVDYFTNAEWESSAGVPLAYLQNPLNAFDNEIDTIFKNSSANSPSASLYFTGSFNDVTINKIEIRSAMLPVISSAELYYQKASDDSWVKVDDLTIPTMAVDQWTVQSFTFNAIEIKGVRLVFTTTAYTEYPLISEIQIFEPGYYPEGYYESAILDTDTTSPIWGKFEVGHSLERQSITYYAKSSSATLYGWTDWVEIQAEETIPIAQNRFFQWKAVMTSEGTFTPNIEAVIMNYGTGKNEGTYTSDTIDFSANVTEYDVFEADYILNDQTLTFDVRTSTDSGTLSSADWVSVLNGGIPDNEVKRYGQWKATFATTDLTKTPVLRNATINWWTGEGSVKRCASITHNGRYYLSANSIGSDYNDTVFMLDKYGNWTKYKGWDLNSFCIYQDDLYGGDSNNYCVWHLGKGNDDDGQTIEAWWTSKDFVFGNIDVLKEYNNMRLSSKVTDAEMTFSYITNINNTQTDIDLDLSEGENIENRKISFEHGDNSRFLKYKFYVKDVEPWSIYMLNTYYQHLDIEEQSYED